MRVLGILVRLRFNYIAKVICFAAFFFAAPSACFALENSCPTEVDEATCSFLRRVNNWLADTEFDDASSLHTLFNGILHIDVSRKVEKELRYFVTMSVIRKPNSVYPDYAESSDYLVLRQLLLLQLGDNVMKSGDIVRYTSYISYLTHFIEHITDASPEYLPRAPELEAEERDRIMCLIESDLPYLTSKQVKETIDYISCIKK